MKKHGFIMTAAAAILAGAMTAGASQAQDVIKIGASAPKSGPLAGGAAVTHWPNLQLWVHTVNAAGGIKVGDKMMTVELTEYDDRTSNEEAVKNYERLATVDKVDFIVVPYGTGINLATAPVIARHGYPQIATTAITDKADEFAERWPNTFWTLDTSTGFAAAVADVLNRHSPDDIQIRGNRTTGPPPRERHLLLQPSDGLILVSGLRLEGHSVIFLAIQTHLSCRFLLTVDFLGPTPERVLAADHRSAVGFSETGRGSPPPPPIGT